MSQEKAWSELKHLQQHWDFVEILNADGCHYGELLSRTVAEIQKRTTTKIAGFETVSQLMLELGRKNKKELEGIKKMVIDAISCTHAAQQTVVDMESRAEKIRDRFEQLQSKFSWRLLWMVLGGVLGGNGLFLAAYVFIELVVKK